ncbi:MAG: hypothetical protein KF805_05180 [Phycisphaeraceae bacterium]|nr:hypothetical protein [Phycisphaeraceae bacterium]
MRKAVFEWVSLVLAVLILGPVAGLLPAMLRSPAGSGQTSALTSTTPMLGIVFTLAALALALVVGMFGSKTVTRPMGMACAGFTLVWVACRFGRAEMIFRESTSPTTSAWLMAIEAAILAIPALWVATWVQRPRPFESDDNVPALAEIHTGFIEAIRALVSDYRGLVAVAAAAGGAVFGCALGSISLLKGQCVFAGVLAGIGAGCAGGLVIAGLDSKPALAPYLGVMLVAIGAPIAAIFIHGSGLGVAAVTGDLTPLGRLIPIDWIAGMFLGVPWGLSWVSGMVKDRVVAAA